MVTSSGKRKKTLLETKKRNGDHRIIEEDIYFVWSLLDEKFSEV